MRLLLLLCAVVYGLEVQAGVYKCQSADGNTTFQQVPCAAAQSEEKVRIWVSPSEPEKNRQASNGLEHEQERNYANHSLPIEAEVDRPAAPRVTVRGIAAPVSERKRLNPCPEGQVPVNQSRSGAASGWRDDQGYTRLRCARPSEGRRNASSAAREHSRVVHDTQGNPYIRNPHSPVIIDTKTGKPCVTSGNVIVHCH